jgi:hypothetical protein
VRWLRASRSGFILPVALLLLLGGTLVAMSLLITARSTILLADGDRVLARTLSDRGPFDPAGRVRMVGGADAEGQEAPLPFGFAVLEAEPVGNGAAVLWRTQAVGWRFSGEEVADRVQAAITLGGTVGGQGQVSAGSIEQGCADPLPLADVRQASPPLPPDPDPPPPGFPRLGPVGIDALHRRSEVRLEPTGEFPPMERAALIGLRDGPSVRVDGGRARGVLSVPGDLILQDEAAFEGLVMVGGDLILEGGAHIVGVALVGGDVDLAAETGLVGCLSQAGAAVAEVTALGMPFPVAGGEFLGRF